MKSSPMVKFREHFFVGFNYIRRAITTFLGGIASASSHYREEVIEDRVRKKLEVEKEEAISSYRQEAREARAKADEYQKLLENLKKEKNVLESELREARTTNYNLSLEVTQLKETNAGLEKKLLEFGKINDQLTEQNKKLQNDIEVLTIRTNKLRDEEARHLGLGIMRDPYLGLAILDSDNNVIFANSAFEAYSRREFRDIERKKLSDVVDNIYFKKQLAIFETQKEEIAKEMFQFEPFVFSVSDIPMTGFYITRTKGRGAGRVYAGAYMLLTPHQSKSGLEKSGIFATSLSGREKVLIGEIATRYDMLKYLKQVMFSGKRNVVIDMRYTSMVEESVIDNLVKCYHKLKEKNMRCNFQNVPRDIAQYLQGKEVHEITNVLEKPNRVLYTSEEISEYLSAQKPSQNPPQQSK